MLSKFLMRVFIGLCFAIPFGLASSVAVQASPDVQEADLEDCTGCHNVIRADWGESAHGQSAVDGP